MGRPKIRLYIRAVDGRFFLNPAYDEVISLISDGVKEIVSNYNVDGIHIDDYFYPTTSPDFDNQAFAQSGQNDLSKWRINNCNKGTSKNPYYLLKKSSECGIIKA